MSTAITAWLDDAQAKVDAATEEPWCLYPTITTVSYIEQSQRDGSVIGGGHVADASPDDAAFIADARTRLPQAIAALRAVLLMHRPMNDLGSPPCAHCLSEDSDEVAFVPWPCPTVRAIATALGVQS